jgi:integrase
VRETIPGLPAKFVFHDLRDYFASSMLAKGLPVNVVSAQMRHKNSTITLRTYEHLMPSAGDVARSALATIIRETREAGTAAAR